MHILFREAATELLGQQSASPVSNWVCSCAAMHILFREVARGAVAGIFIEYGAVVHMLHIRIAAEELSPGHSTLATCSEMQRFSWK